MCFTSSPEPLTPPKNPAVAPGGMVAGFTGPVPMYVGAGKRRISAEEMAKRFGDGRYLYCRGFNFRVAECTAWKNTQMFGAGGEEVADFQGKQDSDALGTNSVSQ